MSTSSRLTSALFTALPGFFFYILFLQSGWLGREYWWGTYLVVLIVLLASSLFFGFMLPIVFQKLRLRYLWISILVQGFLSWTMALIVLGLLNLTPLCVGQNNGDGNNDVSMCMFMTVLSGIVYTPVYLIILAMSSLIGHWLLSLKIKSEALP
jgi:hypothetical protein